MEKIEYMFGLLGCVVYYDISMVSLSEKTKWVKAYKNKLDNSLFYVIIQDIYWLLKRRSCYVEFII